MKHQLDTRPIGKGNPGKRKPRRPTGFGKALDSAPGGSAGKYLVGDNSEEGFSPYAKPSGEHSPVNPDAGYGKGSSVVGCHPKSFV